MSGKTNLSQMPVNSKIRSRKFLYLTFAVIIICLVTVGLMNRDTIIRYYHYSKIHHFSVGDKVYVRNKVFNDTSFKAIFIYRLIRPFTETDIKESNLDELKQSMLRTSDGSKKESKVILSDKALILDSLRQNNNRLAGTFAGKVFITKTTRNGEKLTLLLYAINLKKKVLADGYYKSEDIPFGYTYADNQYYIMYWDTIEK